MLTTVLIGIFLAFLTWPLPVVVCEFDLHTIHTIHKLINLLIGFDFPQWYFVSCVQYLRKSPEQLIIHVTFISHWLSYLYPCSISFVSYLYMHSCRNPIAAWQGSWKQSRCFLGFIFRPCLISNIFVQNFFIVSLRAFWREWCLCAFRQGFTWVIKASQIKA